MILFCCMPLGIFAILSATKVNTAYDQGNYAEAQKASDDAKKWLKYGLIGGVVGIILYVIIVLFGATMSGGGGF